MNCVFIPYGRFSQIRSHMTGSEERDHFALFLIKQLYLWKHSSYVLKLWQDFFPSSLQGIPSHAHFLYGEN